MSLSGCALGAADETETDAPENREARAYNIIAPVASLGWSALFASENSAKTPYVSVTMTQRAKKPDTAPDRWSGKVTRESHALDLEGGVFTFADPRRIARSLKRSAEESLSRKSGAFRSAMSMLNFFINRAGKNLPAERKRVLERAKDELRRAFGRLPRTKI